MIAGRPARSMRMSPPSGISASVPGRRQLIASTSCRDSPSTSSGGVSHRSIATVSSVTGATQVPSGGGGPVPSSSHPAAPTNTAANSPNHPATRQALMRRPYAVAALARNHANG